MKLYSFVQSLHLNNLQAGLQTGHLISDMFMKYDSKCKKGKDLREWASNHKTIIILEGGNCLKLEENYEILKIFSKQLHLPIAKFNEDESLNGALTCVGIITPTGLEYYENSPNSAHYKLLNFLKSQKLKRA